MRGSGETFPAEATISRYEIGRRPFFTVILRNVAERFAADERIRSLMKETSLLRSELGGRPGNSEDLAGRHLLCSPQISCSLGYVLCFLLW